MLKILSSNQFKRDLMLARKRGFDLEHLTEIVNALACQEKLAERYRDHNLTGKY